MFKLNSLLDKRKSKAPYTGDPLQESIEANEIKSSGHEESEQKFQKITNFNGPDPKDKVQNPFDDVAQNTMRNTIEKNKNFVN